MILWGLFFITITQEIFAASFHESKKWFDKAESYETAGNIEKSIETYRIALTHAEAENNLHMKAQILNNLAIILSDSGNRKEGIDLSYKSSKTYLLAGDTSRAANALLNIGIDYIDAGKYEEALKVQLEALELRLQCGDSTNIAAYYLNIGDVYKQLNIDKMWKVFIEKARILAVNPKYAKFTTQISILNELGSTCETEKKYDESIKYYLEMYERCKKEHYTVGMSTALNNLSSVYLAANQSQKALTAAQEALQINTKDNNYYGLVYSYNLLGEVNLVLNKPVDAGNNFLRGLKIAEKFNFVQEKKNSLEGLYKAAKKQGDWKEALIYHENFYSLGDSLQSQNLQEKVVEIEAKYQNEKKERQIESLNKENELKNARIRFQNLYIWGGTMFVLLFAAAAFWVAQQKRRRQKAKQIELEQKLLRSQMNPHFLFNSLGAIQNYMLQNDGRKAAFYLSSFSSLMRSILKNSREELISLQEEKQTLENYLLLHKLRLGDKLSFVINVSEELDTEDIFIPPMLIQPFVENAVIHGIEQLEKNGYIALNFSKEGDWLVISVDDNGPGISNSTQTTLSTHVSYALQIFRERVANLKKKYGTAITYNITDKSRENGSGTLVTVKLPLKT